MQQTQFARRIDAFQLAGQDAGRRSMETLLNSY